MKQFTTSKTIYFLFGLTLLGVCVTLIQQTNLGMSAWDAFNRNLYEGFHLPYSVINPIVALVLIHVAYLLQKRRWSPLVFFPLVISFYVGLVIDLLLLVIPSAVEMNVWVNLAYLLVAIVVCAIGLNFVIYAKYPLPALDELCSGIAKKLHVSFGVGKLIGEILAIVLSVAVGTAFSFQSEFYFIGWTTLIFGLGIGLFVDLFRKPIVKGLDKIEWKLKSSQMESREKTQ